jgi:hypothetical protein
MTAAEVTNARTTPVFMLQPNCMPRANNERLMPVPTAVPSVSATWSDAEASPLRPRSPPPAGPDRIARVVPALYRRRECQHAPQPGCPNPGQPSGAQRKADLRWRDLAQRGQPERYKRLAAEERECQTKRRDVPAGKPGLATSVPRGSNSGAPGTISTARSTMAASVQSASAWLEAHSNKPMPMARRADAGMLDGAWLASPAGSWLDAGANSAAAPSRTGTKARNTARHDQLREPTSNRPNEGEITHALDAARACAPAVRLGTRSLSPRTQGPGACRHPAPAAHGQPTGPPTWAPGLQQADRARTWRSRSRLAAQTRDDPRSRRPPRRDQAPEQEGGERPAIRETIELDCRRGQDRRHRERLEGNN